MRLSLHKKRSEVKQPFAQPARLSLLKPLKGFDLNLMSNLETFFTLDYPKYEILLRVQDQDNPAIDVWKKFLANSWFPVVDARLFVDQADWSYWSWSGHCPGLTADRMENLLGNAGGSAELWVLLHHLSIGWAAHRVLRHFSTLDLRIFLSALWDPTISWRTSRYWLHCGGTAEEI